jgi:hypothetical protein
MPSDLRARVEAARDRGDSPSTQPDLAELEASLATVTRSHREPSEEVIRIDVAELELGARTLGGWRQAAEAVVETVVGGR